MKGGSEARRTLISRQTTKVVQRGGSPVSPASPTRKWRPSPAMSSLTDEILRPHRRQPQFPQELQPSSAISSTIPKAPLDVTMAHAPHAKRGRSQAPHHQQERSRNSPHHGHQAPAHARGSQKIKHYAFGDSLWLTLVRLGPGRQLWMLEMKPRRFLVGAARTRAVPPRRTISPRNVKLVGVPGRRRSGNRPGRRRDIFGGRRCRANPFGKITAGVSREIRNYKLLAARRRHRLRQICRRRLLRPHPSPACALARPGWIPLPG